MLQFVLGFVLGLQVLTGCFYDSGLTVSRTVSRIKKEDSGSSESDVPIEESGIHLEELSASSD